MSKSVSEGSDGPMVATGARNTTAHHNMPIDKSVIHLKPSHTLTPKTVPRVPGGPEATGLTSDSLSSAKPVLVAKSNKSVTPLSQKQVMPAPICTFGANIQAAYPGKSWPKTCDNNTSPRQRNFFPENVGDGAQSQGPQYEP